MPSGDNNRKLSDVDRLLVIEMYTNRAPDGTWTGATTIAKHFGVHRNAIYHFLKSRGVVMRSTSEALMGKACRPRWTFPVGEPRLCRCGCGEPTSWDRKHARWYAKVPGHRVPQEYPNGRSKGSPGAKNPAWKGGVTPERQRLYKTAEWKAALAATFARDDYHCRRCGTAKTGGVVLHAHHIASFAEHQERRFDLDNLVTLCRTCHLWVHSKQNIANEFLA
jgi:hypothetical protein